ncbi:leucine-rich repeat-containing protein 53 [Xyrauchen texanus]|uniref:leucine-rich repeat-containing protein 53 n=1 Tax=Xyrauchen texanus TaxID=154827 RepID=UPI00224290E3|nr:leucine-rich repeat-containing protein 53 [Xyrauchen texanus]
MWLEWKTMRSAFLILMVTIAQVKISLPCPSSCVVCSEDVIICHKLLNIIDAPGTTKALMLTDGLINSVDNMVFSDLSNMSVLALSNNAISTIKENAFWNLTFLTALSLDHNHISSQSLDNSTFSWLHRLETLHLGSNALRDIDGSWFQNSRALKTLQLEGNLLTSLNSSTFALSNLRNLEMLDLSDNLIMYLGRDSFRGLPHLHSLDLSRNLLKNAPDAFSYLSGLSMLNLDLNHWSCTCELRELASFLNSYIQAPDKVLNNGQRLVCVNTDNPAVQTVLELTKANCVPPNKNITGEVVDKSNITPQQYIRNVAIAIVLSFLGGVGITLGIIAIAYHKLSRKFKQVQEENGAMERKTSSPETAQWNFCEDKDTQSMSHALYNYNYKSHQPWDRENSPSHMRPDTVANHFTCHKCISTALAVGKQKREIVLQRANLMCEQHERDDDWPIYVACRQHKGNQHSVLQQKIKDTSVQRHDERGAGISNNHHLGSQCTSSQLCGDSNGNSAVKIQQLALRNNFSALQRGPFRPPDQMHKELVTHGNHINQSLLKHQAKVVGTQPIYRTISCLHCHQTDEYRQAGSNNQSFPFLNHSENTLQNGAKMYDAMLYRDFLGYNKSSSGEHGKKQAIDLGFKLASQRNVTFDLAGSEERILTTQADRHKGESRIKSSKTSVQKSNQKLAKMKSSTQGHLKNNKTKAQAKRTLKVKLNLNPLRKNRVHPKSGDQKKNEEGNMSKKAKKEKLRSKKDQKVLSTNPKKRKPAKN